MVVATLTVYGRQSELDHAEGNALVCQPMAVDVTGPGLGTAPSTGAVQLARWLWAPYQVEEPGEENTSQHTPSAERVARVTAPAAVGSVATLTVDASVAGPAT